MQASPEDHIANYNAAVGRLERAKAQADALAAEEPSLKNYHDMSLEEGTGMTPYVGNMTGQSLRVELWKYADPERVRRIILEYHYALEGLKAARRRIRAAGVGPLPLPAWLVLGDET
jgi:hypothetical protein